MSAEEWVESWGIVLAAEPTTPESVKSRLKTLVEGSPVGNAKARPLTADWTPSKALLHFVWFLDLTSNPAAFDSLWHAIFELAEELGCYDDVREQTYYWSENYLIQPPWDAEPDDEESEGQEHDMQYISSSLGASRLFALGYGYSDFAWNALLDGLGLGDEGNRNSDSLRIAACTQLLGAGQRLRLFLKGEGETKQTSGFAGKYLQERAGQEKDKWAQAAPDVWANWLKALVDQQKVAGPVAKAILEKTHLHLLGNRKDLSSAEVANSIGPLK